MGEINHFMHKEHSLKFIENLEAVVRVGDDNGEKKDVFHCVGCSEPISSGSAYGCIPCNWFLHRACAKATPTINHHLHPLHPFELICTNFEEGCCQECANTIISKASFVYRCERCNFGICFKCGVAYIATIALKEEALIKFQHKGHPQHTLTLQLRSAAFRCDACYTEEKDLFYQCDSCDFWIHKSCTSLASTIKIHHHRHSLVLVYSLPDNFFKFWYFCEFCKKIITKHIWLYHCANCRYFAHIKCALNAGQTSIPSDSLGTSVDEAGVNDFLHFPLSDAFTDPLKLLHLEKASFDDDGGARQIIHWSHDHPLILNVEPQGNNMPNIGYSDPIEVCNGCVRPLSLPYYNCKRGCSFTLHKYCAELPRTLQHQLHPDHSLRLVNTSRDEYCYKCNGCFSWGNKFAYTCETCKFYLDVNCANLPNTIIHESHKHPLIQVINDPKRYCNACNQKYSGISFACKACKFQLDMFCALQSPRFLTHRYCKGHEIPLTYPPVEDHPEDFYCDICEKEMHPKRPLYHCYKCKNSFHLDCINRIDFYANVKWEGIMTKSCHKHPLTYVRRKTTCEYVCSFCNLDINGRLTLECRTGTCPFRTCYPCSKRESK